MNYTTLQSAIADYLHRSDLTTQIPTFISLAEAAIFRDLSIKETETSVSGVTVGGYAVLPTDFGSITKLQITFGGTTTVLEYIALSSVSTTVTASPGYYSFENGKLKIYGTSDGQAYTLFYLPAIAPLSSTVTTNWMLENAPDLYLYASCLEGAKYTRDVDETMKLGAIVQNLTDAVRRAAERKGQPTSGILQIKPRSTT